MPLAENEISPEEVRALADRFEGEPLTTSLAWAWERFGPRAAIGTSFQGAGLVMIDHALKAGLPFPIFTLDTNLLFPETYELKRKLEDYFGIVIEPVEPEVTLAQQTKEFGAKLWNSKPDLCCQIRKVEPLKAKFDQLAAWITGLRRQQSDTRGKTRIVELYHFDLLRDLHILKLNPMANWTRDQVWDYIKANKIPYNPLHDQGYRSIGCWPCTRPTAAGENERAGRWTGFDKAECGIHTFLGDSI